MPISRLFLAVGACLSLAACATRAPEPVEPLVPVLPVMQWDHRPEAEVWTEATLTAFQELGAPLLSATPGDIAVWCPAYEDADAEQRAAFWTGLLSALARHESTWNPEAVGGGGRWFGLVQIDPRTAQGYGCAARSGQALLDGTANLRCAVRIATAQVTRRDSVARGMLDWGPFHNASKREQMRAWVSEQEYCQGASSSEG